MQEIKKRDQIIKELQDKLRARINGEEAKEQKVPLLVIHGVVYLFLHIPSFIEASPLVSFFSPVVLEILVCTNSAAKGRYDEPEARERSHDDSVV
jgi:hypothetical protein